MCRVAEHMTDAGLCSASPPCSKPPQSEIAHGRASPGVATIKRTEFGSRDSTSNAEGWNASSFCWVPDPNLIPPVAKSLLSVPSTLARRNRSDPFPLGRFCCTRSTGGTQRPGAPGCRRPTLAVLFFRSSIKGALSFAGQAGAMPTRCSSHLGLGPEQSSIVFARMFVLACLVMHNVSWLSRISPGLQRPRLLPPSFLFTCQPIGWNRHHPASISPCVPLRW